MVKERVKEYTLMQIKIYMKGNGKMIIETDMENKLI